MPDSEPELSYEDVFREFVQRSLEQEKAPAPQPAVSPPGSGRRPTSGSGSGSGSEAELAERGPPPAKRRRGRGRGRGRSRGRGRPAESSNHGESVGDLNQHSSEPERRRSSRRSGAQSVDYRHLLEQEEEEGEDDPAADWERSSAADESGDDWRPSSRGARSSGEEVEGAPVARGTAGRRRRGRPPARGGGVTRYRLPEEAAVSVNTPPPPPADTAPAAAHNSALKTGDFLISVEDVNLDRPPIWRIDGKFLIQKYEPIKGKGQRLYKNMATYMSWSATTDKFRPVSVRYHQMGRSEIIVELLDNPHSSTFNLSKMLSIEATAKYLENFEIFTQTLISQALDSNFLLEITQEGDEYFMKNVAVVQETNLERKKKILELKSWDEKTQSELDTLPVLELVLLRNVPPSECAVCHQTANARLVQLYGRPYDRTTMLTVQLPLAGPGKRQHNMCSFCAGLADLYNKVEHLTYHLYLRCCEKVAQRRKEAPDHDSTRILNDILADEAWLSKAFSDVQQIWGDVDQIYSAAKEEEKEQQQQQRQESEEQPAAAGSS